MQAVSRRLGPDDLRVDVLVVGAGQAGLAAGHYLAQTALSFQVFDRVRRVGESWRRRHDSLVLFSSRAYSHLPGLAMDGDPEGYPTKDETADYLERYARFLRLPLALGEGVVQLEENGSYFLARTDARRAIAARAVIVAAGAFQQSIVPAFASALPLDVVQLPANRYRNLTQIPQGRVLVVGGNSSGRQIARELATERRVSLSVGRSMVITPQRVLGRDVTAWFDALGLLRADVIRRGVVVACRGRIMHGETARHFSHRLGDHIARHKEVILDSSSATLESSSSRLRTRLARRSSPISDMPGRVCCQVRFPASTTDPLNGAAMQICTNCLVLRAYQTPRKREAPRWPFITSRSSATT